MEGLAVTASDWEAPENGRRHQVEVVGSDRGGTAVCVEENVSTMQPTTHLYELSEPYEGHVNVLVTVSTLPHCADDTRVVAATATGAAIPDPEMGSYWTLAHFADDTPHEDALRAIGYEVVDAD